MKKKLLLLLFIYFTGIVTLIAQSDKKAPQPPQSITEGINSQKEFLKRNPSVVSLEWQNEKQKTIILILKSGVEETYDLTNETVKREFNIKYGNAPMQPPPPPNAEVTKFTPPTIVKDKEVKKVEMVKFSPPIMKAEEIKADEFYKRNPSVKEIYRQGDFLFIKHKDGKAEKYDGKNDTEMKKFVDKYGESPIPLPPPKVNLSNFTPPPKPVKS